MKKVLKYSSIIAVGAFVTFGVWITILTAYELIAGPETFTKFEALMSLLVSGYISEKICDFVFKVQDKCTDKAESANDIIPLDKMIEMYEKEFNSDSYIVRQNIAYLKELKHRRGCGDLKEGAEE